MDERELVIKRGEEFKISVKDKIEKTDLFYDQYISAAKMLNDIVSYADKDTLEWEHSEFENNIIAFCGERGEGKSSAMMSFSKAVYEHDNHPDVSIFEGLDRIKNTYFAEPIVIDPSMLDDVHNVLDIILATLYKKFQDQYKENNQSIDGYKREELLDRFQKVYQCISLINNQNKMLDDEYDYEGNIGKLSKLGQSTGLKRELQELIQTYIEIMPDAKKKDGKSGCLLVAIDDLDLCNSYAYKVAEQIRKYLVIPNVVIIMALKVEQLQLCVRENNHKDYERMLRVPQERREICAEIANMSERYVAKLIPKIRRIYLPNVHMMQNVRLVYQEGEEQEKTHIDQKEEEKKKSDKESVSSVDKSLLNLIYQKTGMKFLPDKTGKNYFLPDNLRDTINIVALLMDMEEPEGKNQEEENQVYYENVLRFFNYYERQWLFSNVSLDEYKDMQSLIHADLQLHRKSAFLLEKRYDLTEEKSVKFPLKFSNEKNDGSYLVMEWFETYRANVFGEKTKKYAYVFQVLYTIRMNKLLRNGKYDELIRFMGGHIWGGYFKNVLPSVQNTNIDRSRFALSTVRAYNTIAKELYPNKDILLPESDDMQQYYVKEITHGDPMSKEKLVTWTLLGMLSNTWNQNEPAQFGYSFNTNKMIAMNHSLVQQVQISIENYIVNLCNLNSIYEKVNVECLGISTKKEDDSYKLYEIFNEIMKDIQKSNEEVIEICRRIAVNTDIAMEFLDYCSERKDIKDRGVKSELERHQLAVHILFQNVGDFAKEYLKKELDDMENLKLVYDEGEGEVLISRIYALLVEAATQERDSNVLSSRDEKRREKMLKAFTDKLTTRVDKVPARKTVSEYLNSMAAKNVKMQMSSLASNIQRYYSLHSEEKMNETDMIEMCDFYNKILDVYLENPQGNLSEELIREYEKIRNKYDIVCQ